MEEAQRTFVDDYASEDRKMLDWVRSPQSNGGTPAPVVPIVQAVG